MGILGFLYPDFVMVKRSPREELTLGPEHEGGLVADVLCLERGVHEVGEQNRVGMPIELVSQGHGFNRCGGSSAGLVHGVEAFQVGILGWMRGG